jgi:hypothetical protein
MFLGLLTVHGTYFARQSLALQDKVSRPLTLTRDTTYGRLVMRPPSLQRPMPFPSRSDTCMTCAVLWASPMVSLLGYRIAELPSEKAIACAIAAAILFALSLLLRGVLRLISLVIVLLLAAAAFWWIREGWGHRGNVVPAKWLAVADKALLGRESRAAWHSIQSEFAMLSSEARSRIAKGGEDARRTVLERIDAKVRELRKAGKADEAGELLRLRELVAREK